MSFVTNCSTSRCNHCRSTSTMTARARPGADGKAATNRYSASLTRIRYLPLAQDFNTDGKSLAKGGRSAASGFAGLFPPLGAIQWHRLVLDEAHTVGGLLLVFLG